MVRLGRQSLVAMLLELHRKKRTGRLVLTNGKERREIHLIEGRLSYVYSEHVRLQLPRFLVERLSLGPKELEDRIVESLTLDRFLALAADRSGAVHRDLMRLRFEECLNWRQGDAVFHKDLEPLRPPSALISSEPLGHLTARAMARTRSEPELLESLEFALDRPLTAVVHRSELLAALKPDRHWTPLINSLLDGRTIRSAARDAGPAARTSLSLALVMLEGRLAVAESAAMMPMARPRLSSGIDLPANIL
jgi:hypothetical protein